MVDWRNINQHESYSKVRAELKKRIAPENYGFEKDNWNLSEIMQEPTQMGVICTQIIAGETSDGKKNGPEIPMEAPDGRGGFPFRLKVLTRQACDVAEDGKYINGWSAGRRPKHLQTTENTYFPEHDELPKEGDVISIKRAPRADARTPAERNAILARGESPWHLTKKTVDADGCIWCEYAEAHQLLHRAGLRLVFPEFGRPDRPLEEAAKKGHGEAPRRITKWHFEEVPHEYAAPKKRTRKKADTAAA